MSNGSVLVVEDEILIARDLQYLLEDMGYTVPAIATTSDAALEAIVALRPDLVLLDIHLADGSDGLAVAEWLHEHGNIPVIFLTAHADAATIARAQATGPYGYLLKPFNERELGIAVQLVLAKSASDRQLGASERLLSTTLRSIADGVIVTDTSNQITYLNPRAEQITGWSAHEAIGSPLPTIFIIQRGAPDDAAEPPRNTQASPPHTAGQVLVLRDGGLRPIEDTVAPIADKKGVLYGAVVVFRDVTERHSAEAERRQLERKMHETQRLESLGVLASGIAHDFNNILTSILGYVQLTDDQLAPGGEAHGTLKEAMVGLRRAADLTAQLLTYAGRGHSIIRPVALNAIVRELTSLLRGTIAAHALLELQLGEALPTVLGDATQLSQVVLNLLTNAVEAIGTGCGAILVRTELLQVPQGQGQDMLFGEQLNAGPYVCITVRDSGCGMSEETRARIFDPFFTTKFTGRGLGLAAVQGIVRGHTGAMRIDSAPGAGTTFQIYLPVTEGPILETAAPEDGASRAPPLAAPSQPEQRTLLLIDDEPDVRSMMARMLTRMGFCVHTAADGAAGLALLDSDLPQLDGIFLDLTMPGLSGPELVHAINQARPGTPIAMMSGYQAEEIAARHNELQPRCFLQKPFTRAALEAALTVLLAPEAE